MRNEKEHQVCFIAALNDFVCVNQLFLTSQQQTLIRLRCEKRSFLGLLEDTLSHYDIGILFIVERLLKRAKQ